MPELPEVETVRRALERRLVGRRIASVDVRKPTFYRKPPPAAIAALNGATLTAISRRGKFLLFELGGRPSVVFHLGMSGRLTIGADGPHVRLQVRFDGDELFFHDTRRFGRVGGPLPALGPEPIDDEFNAAFLAGILRGRTAPVKALLMDQKLIAGLGNIYATEALHRAGVRPARPGRRVSVDEIEKLAAACREVLERGIELGGSTLDDESFLDPLGQPGRMQDFVRVYGRKTCAACETNLKKTSKPIGGRTSVFCPSCQR